MTIWLPIPVGALVRGTRALAAAGSAVARGILERHRALQAVAGVALIGSGVTWVASPGWGAIVVGVLMLLDVVHDGRGSKR